MGCHHKLILGRVSTGNTCLRVREEPLWTPLSALVQGPLDRGSLEDKGSYSKKAEVQPEQLFSSVHSLADDPAWASGACSVLDLC